jgi:hypothetical protein
VFPLLKPAWLSMNAQRLVMPSGVTLHGTRDGIGPKHQVASRSSLCPHPCTCRYDFTDGDLSVSLAQLHEYLDTYEAPPYK